MESLTLYGAPHSLYTGRARCYLIKANIPYREAGMSSEHYRTIVLPKAGRRAGIPTLELANGDVIRDGAAIIDHFEEQSGHAFSPATPKQRLFSRLLDVIGAEGLLRPAMHYRWNFPKENDAFLKYHFEGTLASHREKEARAETARNSMRGATRGFGVNPETFALTERLYLNVLDRLDEHLRVFPYLLGGKPCIGDFGMIAPLFAHLGRDPKPLSIMQARALGVLRWVERMNRYDADVAEFVDPPNDFLPDDDIPNTLLDVLKAIAVDFVPETRAAAETINGWLADQDNLEPGTTAERGLGFGQFTIDGVEISALAQPYRFYLLNRVQDEFEDMNNVDREATSALLDQCDMRDIIGIKLTRKIGRNNNLEVWL